MPVSNSYVEPTAGTALNTARSQFNDSMRAVLTTFKGPTIPSSLRADGALFTTEQDGMLFRSTVTNALYTLDSANKQAGNIGGGFTRWGIGTRIEASLATLTTRAAVSNFYETGELVITLDTGKLYVKNGTPNNIDSFVDVGVPGYTIGTNDNVTIAGQSVTTSRFLATSNVGIATNTPAATLHVVGTGIISGTLTGNSITATSYTTPASAYSAASWLTVGPAMHVASRTYTDTSSAANATLASRTSFSILRPTYAASSANVNITSASTMYIQGNPIEGANTNFSSNVALFIDAGKMHINLGGTPAIPAISIGAVATSSNTGIFSSSTSTLGISILGNTAVTFTSLGRITATTETLSSVGSSIAPTLSLGSSATNGFYTSLSNTINVTGNFVAAGDVSAFSDERLKSNIRTIDNALAKVMQLRGVYFDKDSKASTGVIAQEIEKVLPEVVTNGEYKSVSYGNMIGLLIEAIKELEIRIIELETRVE
jgi:hypothetical protein